MGEQDRAVLSPAVAESHTSTSTSACWVKAGQLLMAWGKTALGQHWHRNFPQLPPQQLVPELWGAAPVPVLALLQPGPLPRSAAGTAPNRPAADHTTLPEATSKNVFIRSNSWAQWRHEAPNRGPTAAQEPCQPATVPGQDWHQHQKPQAWHIFLFNYSQAELPQLTGVWGVATCLTLPNAPRAWHSWPPASAHLPDISSHVGIPRRQGHAPDPGSSSCGRAVLLTLSQAEPSCHSAAPLPRCPHCRKPPRREEAAASVAAGRMKLSLERELPAHTTAKQETTYLSLYADAQGSLVRMPLPESRQVLQEQGAQLGHPCSVLPAIPSLGYAEAPTGSQDFCTPHTLAPCRQQNPLVNANTTFKRFKGCS